MYTCLRIMKKTFLTLLILTILISSCATAKVSSHRLTAYNGKMDKVYIMAKTDSASQAFIYNLVLRATQEFSLRNIVLKWKHSDSDLARLEKDDAFTNEIREFAPDLILEVTKKGERKDSFMTPGFNDGTRYVHGVRGARAFVTVKFRLLRPSDYVAIWQAEIETGVDDSFFLPAFPRE